MADFRPHKRIEGNAWVKNDKGKYVSTHLSSYCGGYTREFADNLVRALEPDSTARASSPLVISTSRILPNGAASWTSARPACSPGDVLIPRRPDENAQVLTPQPTTCDVLAQKRVRWCSASEPPPLLQQRWRRQTLRGGSERPNPEQKRTTS